MVPSNSEPLPFICLFRVHLWGCEWEHTVWWVTGMSEVIFTFYKYQSLAFSTFNDMTLVFWHPSVKKEWPKPYRKIKTCHNSKSRGICLVLNRTGSKIRCKRSHLIQTGGKLNRYQRNTELWSFTKHLKYFKATGKAHFSEANQNANSQGGVIRYCVCYKVNSSS